jgi:crotonobetainyl-CoA:carnitine CoA-transferase CaiB-like acyl-CoA transferase
MDEMGVNYATLRELNPNLIHAQFRVWPNRPHTRLAGMRSIQSMGGLAGDWLSGSAADAVLKSDR